MEYTWSFDREIWENDKYDTIAECIETARECMRNDKYDTVYIGEAVLYQPEIEADDVLKILKNNAYIKCSKVAECWKPLGKDKDGELGNALTKVLLEWLKKHNLMPDFGIVKNIQEYSLGIKEKSNGGSKMNHMKQVAEMLGVELGEEFKVRYKDSDEVEIDDKIIKINEDGLRIKGYENVVAYALENLLLRGLIDGSLEVVKLPWKPKNREKYWCVNTLGYIHSNIFDSYTVNLLWYKAGRMYRTYEEAKAHLEEDKRYWDEIEKELME